MIIEQFLLIGCGMGLIILSRKGPRLGYGADDFFCALGVYYVAFAFNDIGRAFVT